MAICRWRSLRFQWLSFGWTCWLFGIDWYGSPRAFKATITLGPWGLGIVRNPR